MFNDCFYLCERRRKEEKEKRGEGRKKDEMRKKKEGEERTGQDRPLTCCFTLQVPAMVKAGHAKTNSKGLNPCIHRTGEKPTTSATSV